MKGIWRQGIPIGPNVVRSFYLALLLMMLASVATVDAGTVVVSTGSDPVANGTSFQAAVNAAQCGDTLVLQAGATYATAVSWTNSYGPQGYPFTLPNKSCASGQFITIQTSAIANLPAGRVSYANIPQMATLATNTTASAISYAAGAGSYKWIGIVFTNTANVGNH